METPYLLIAPMKEKNLDLVINFLEKELQKLDEEIKSEKGQCKEKVEFKRQLIDGISSLKLCSINGLYANTVDCFEIPEVGSESYFTEFVIVDEGLIDNIPDRAIIRDEQGPIRINCFDLIIRRKK